MTRNLLLALVVALPAGQFAVAQEDDNVGRPVRHGGLVQRQPDGQAQMAAAREQRAQAQQQAAARQAVAASLNAEATVQRRGHRGDFHGNHFNQGQVTATLPNHQRMQQRHSQRARTRHWQQNQIEHSHRADEFAHRRGQWDNPGATRDWQNRHGYEHSEWNRRRWRQHHHWDRRHRSRSWWRSHYTRFALFGGGYYYWNGGYWYPAYGYDPRFTTYVYDAPIYGYGGLAPGQIVAQVQARLQRLGYDAGGVDGAFGPATRGALIEFQEDNGLPPTGEIDEITLEALGLQ